MKPSNVVLSLLACALLGRLAPAQSVPTPEEHLGRPVAVDFELADWDEVSSWFELLGDRSPRATTERVGTTTEGRPFLTTTIASEANLARLDEIRRLAARIADPRGLDGAEKERVLGAAVPILMISNAMHSTETAAPQFAMEFAHLLATSDEEPWRTARERLVVVVIPCTNPDGLDEVASWYRATVGTPHESTGLTRLYQLYAGHDNNRDWFMLSLEETRIVTRLLYSEWHPQVYWDVHQQGSTAERMFIPPFRDPLNPNLDPGIIAGIDAIGSRALFDLTREGVTGISTGVSYDMWWNGGNRNVPVRHNIIGLLTEAASVRYATPIFLRPSELRAPRGLGEYRPSNRFPAPWPGGWWRLRDIVDYELAFGRSLLRTLSEEPRTWLENALEAAERTIRSGREGAPKGWILPSDNADPGAVRRLTETLLACGVELNVATAEVRADGRPYPAGSIVILRDQPYGNHVKDLFEVQRYPEGEPPYDVAGWTLPYLLGVHRVECVAVPEGEWRLARGLDDALAAFEGDGDDALLSASESATWSAVFDELQQGRGVRWRGAGEVAGTFVPGVTEAAGEGDVDLGSMPRIGVYSPWSGNMDEGWMRWVLDEWGVRYVTLRNESLRAGRLGERLDVVVLPSRSGRDLDRGRAPGSAPIEFTGGLDPEGAIALEEFVRAGGTLVAVGRASAWAADLFRLPIVDATREADGFSCPGSVLRGVPAAGRITAGLPASVPLFFSRSAAWRPATSDEVEEQGLDGELAVETLLEYAPRRVLLSGWIREPETVHGRGAWVRASVERGTVHLFGFSPHYRAWSQGTFQLLFRAMLLGGA